MAVDGPVIDIDVLAIGGVHQLVPVLDVTGTMGQGLQQQELGYRQIDRPALPVAEMARGVKQQIAALDDLARRTGRSRLALAQALAPQQGPDALDEQALGEGLLDVIVGAHAQAHELVDLVILGGQEDHGQIALLAQPVEQLEAVHARHLDVEDRQIDRLGGQALQSLRAVRENTHDEALGLQRHGDRGQDVAIVIDKRDGLRHGYPPPPMGWAGRC